MLQFIIRNSLVAIQLPLARDGHGCPKLNAQSFAGRKTNRAFISQECGAEQGIVRFWKIRMARGITVFSRINAVCAFFVAIAEKIDYN